VGWEPSNELGGASFIDGSWYDDESDISAPEVAGIVWFGDVDEYEECDNDELIIECSLDDLRIASCGDCKVIAEVKMTAIAEIRYSQDGSIVMVWRDGKPLRCPTQGDMDSLPVGEDMTDEEVAELDD
jgi:hypothetical protein